MANGMATWQVKIEADVKDLQQKIRSIEKESIKLDLDIDTAELNKAISNLNKMLGNLGKGSHNFEDFELLSTQLSRCTGYISEMGRAFANMDSKGGMTKLLNTINQLDTSFKQLIADFTVAEVKTDDGIIKVSAVTKTLEVLDSLDRTIKSIGKSLSEVDDNNVFGGIIKQIKAVQEACDNIKLSFNLDVGDINDSKSQQRISKAANRQAQAYEALFHKIAKKYDASLYKYQMPEGITENEKSGIYKNLIDQSQKRQKRVKYSDVFIDEYKEIANARSAVRRAEKNATVDGNVLENVFEKSEVDLTGIIGQLETIIGKLDNLANSAKTFSESLSNGLSGLNLTTQLDQIQKLQDEITGLKSQIQSLQSASVSVPASVSNNQSATQNKYQQKSTSKQVNTTGINGTIVTDMDGVEKKIREETEYLIKNTQGIIKELTSFYNTKDELVKTQMKVLDQAGNMTTYTTSFSKRLKDDGTVDYDVWQSHIDQEKSTEDLKERKTAYDQLISTIGEYSTLLKKVAGGDVADGDVKRLKQLRESITALQSNPVLSNSQIETSQKKLTELYNTVKKIRETLLNSQQSQTQSFVDKTAEKQLEAYKKIQKIKLEILKLDENDPKVVGKQQELQAAKEEFATATNILKLHQQDYDVEKQRAEMQKIYANYQEQGAAYSKSQAMSLVNKTAEKQLNAYKKMQEIKLKIEALDGSKDSGKIAKLEQEQDAYKQIYNDCEAILNVNRQNYDIEEKIAAQATAKAKIDSDYATLSLANVRDAAVKNADSVINSYSSKYNTYSSSKPVDKSENYENEIKQLNVYIKKLRELREAIAASGNTDDVKKLEQSFKDVSTEVDKTITNLKQMSASEKGSTELSRLKEVAKIEASLRKNTSFSQQAKDELQSYISILRSGNADVDVSKIAEAWRKVEEQEIAAGNGGQNFTSMIKNSGIHKFAADLANMVSLWDIINVIRQAGEAVIELNTDIVDLAKVSEQTTSQIYADFQSYADIAADMGATISDTITATTAWSKNGYNIEDSKELAQVSILYKNVGDDITIDEANESLISTLQGFQMTADEAEHIIDVFNEVSKNIGEVA